MSMVASGTSGSYLQRAPRPSGLADVLDVILDKGLVIDAYVRVSLIGIEILTIDARIVVASVDTYLRYAEAVNRLDLSETDLFRVPDFQEKAAEQVTKGAIEGVKEEVTPESSTARNALKGVAAGALAAGAAAAAKKLADRARETNGASEE